MGCIALSQISPSCNTIPSPLCKCGPATLWELKSCTTRLAPSSIVFGNTLTSCMLPIFKRNLGFHGVRDEGDNLFYSFYLCQKKFTNMLCSTNAVFYLPKATQRVLSKRENASWCLIRPWLGTSPRPRSKQRLAHDRSSPSRTFWDWFPSGGSLYFSHMNFTQEIRWAKAVQSKSFSKRHLLMALSWTTSVNKPYRKSGW